mgnify:FL=1
MFMYLRKVRLYKMDNEMTRADNKFAEYVMELDYSSIGSSVYAGNISSSVLSDIMAISRRAFRRQDVIVYVGIDMDEEYDEGMVFTGDAIIYWLDSGEEVVRIPYSEIERVDFDDTDIIIEHGDTVLSITLGEDAEDEKYPRYYYGYIRL